MKFEQHSETTYYASGNYTATGVLIKLERKALSHILQIILPSAMFVAVSWISFLMEMESGERAGLLVTLFLVLVSMFLSVVSEAPKAQFVTAKEIWMMACIVFVFLAIAEYGIILSTQKKGKNKKLCPTLKACSKVIQSNLCVCACSIFAEPKKKCILRTALFI